MEYNERTRPEEVPEFLPCGHNAHWEVWHSLAKGECCVFCRAESAELQSNTLLSEWKALMSAIGDHPTAELAIRAVKEDRAERDSLTLQLEEAKRKYDDLDDVRGYEQNVLDNYAHEEFRAEEGKTWESGFNARKFVEMVRDKINDLKLQIGELRRVLSHFTDGGRGHSISDGGKCCKYHMIIGLERVWPCPVAEAQRLVADKPNHESDQK